MRGMSCVPNAWRNCSITPPSVTACGCIRSHVTALASPVSRVGEPGDGRGDVFGRNRLERRRRFGRGQIERQRRQRAQHRAAAIGRRAPPQTPAAGSREAIPDAAISRSASRLVLAEGGAILSAAPGIEMCTRRIARPESPIACSRRATKSRCTAPVSLPGPSCSTPIQLTTTSMACSRSSRASDAASIDITGNSRSSSLDFCEAGNVRAIADDTKPSRAQIVGDEAADQAGSAEHEDVATGVPFMLPT